MILNCIYFNKNKLKLKKEKYMQPTSIGKHFKFDPIFQIEESFNISKKKKRKTYKNRIQTTISNLPDITSGKKQIQRYKKNNFKDQRHKPLSIQSNCKGLKQKNNFIFSLQKDYNRKTNQNYFKISTSKTFVITHRQKRIKSDNNQQNKKMIDVNDLYNIDDKNPFKIQEKKQNKINNIYRAFCSKNPQEKNQQEQNLVQIKYSQLNSIIKAEKIQIKRNQKHQKLKIIDSKKQSFYLQQKRNIFQSQITKKHIEALQFGPWKHAQQNLLFF